MRNRGVRVSFLGCTGPANEGALIATVECSTWGRMARVLWDNGETTWVRLIDLVLNHDDGVFAS